MFASNKGNSFAGFFFLSLIFSPIIGFIFAAIAKEEKKPQQVLVINNSQQMAVATPAEEINALEHLAILKEKGIVTEEEFAKEKAKILRGGVVTNKAASPKQQFSSGRYIGGYSTMPYPVNETVSDMGGGDLKVYQDLGHGKVGSSLATIDSGDIISFDAFAYTDLLTKVGETSHIFKNKMIVNDINNRYLFVKLKNGEYLVFEFRGNDADIKTKKISEDYNILLH